jgi:hypothetical protein
MALTELILSNRPLEHMEEDDETPRALPEWVELEYKASARAFPS